MLFCKGDAKAIQIIIGISIIGIFFLSYVLAPKIVRFIVGFIKQKSKKNKNKKETVEPVVIFTSKKVDRTISRVALNFMKEYTNRYLKTGLITVFVTKVAPVFTLISMQLVFIHMDFRSLKYMRHILKSSSVVNFCCAQLDKYLFEEVLYSVLFVANCFVILVAQKKRRFSNYIMKKHHKQFKLEETKETSTMKTLNAFQRIKQKLSFHKKSFTPSISFSTVGRSITSAVYAIYTYDVLNIMMSIYVDNISASLIANVSEFSGILVDFFFQIFQVIFIGVKYYPILMAADADPNVFVYFFTSLYLIVIFLVRFLNNTFCSHREMFAKRTLNKISSNFKSKLMEGLTLRYNVSNKILSVLSDDPNPNEKYIHALKNVIPSQFKEAFGTIVPEFNFSSAHERIVMNNFPMPNSFYYEASNR